MTMTAAAVVSPASPTELRAIGNNVNQIARALNVAVQSALTRRTRALPPRRRPSWSATKCGGSWP